jgi:hypothetical protein
VTIAWAVLIAATLVSWYVGADHGSGHAARELATIVVLLVAFVKVRIVGLYFIEIRRAPTPLRALFEAWCVLVCAGVVGIYLVAG